MSNPLMPLSLLCATTLCFAAPAAAQTVDASTLDAAVTAPHRDARATLRQAFQSEAGQAATRKLGLEPSGVADRIAALDASSASALAARVETGGSTIVISATTLIIILLVLILITD